MGRLFKNKPKDKLIWLVLFETITIIALVIILINTSFLQKPSEDPGFKDEKGKIHLLSSRIYSDLLPAKNRLILNFKPLQDNLEEFIEKNDLNASIYVLNLRDGASMGIDENREFEPASLNKLPVAIIILKKVESGELTLDTMLPIHPQDRDSLSGGLYMAEENELSVNDLLYNMLAYSDNTAFNALNWQVSLEELWRLSTYINYYEVLLASNNSIKMRITPKTTANLFSSLYLSTILEPENSEKILSILTESSFDVDKYANLPPDVLVAQKYGVIGNGDVVELFNDCGILYVEDSRIFYCVSINNIEKKKTQSVIGEIVNSIYRYVIQMRQVNKALI